MKNTWTIFPLSSVIVCETLEIDVWEVCCETESEKKTAMIFVMTTEFMWMEKAGKEEEREREDCNSMPISININ